MSLPRPAADPDYLRRLREKALARMQQDEAPALVTRRWSLQRIGLLAASLTPAATLLKPAFAAPTGSLRCPAPQYGAPGLPGNPAFPRPTAFATKASLSSLDAWPKSYVVLLTEERSKDGIYGNGAPSARTAYYLLPSGDPLSLNLINVPAAKEDGKERAATTFIISGPEAMYVSYAGELYGAKFLQDEVVLVPSLFKTPTPPTGDGEVITRFAAMVDEKALQKLSAPSRAIHIPVNGNPWSGWGIHSASLAKGILQVEGVAIDLKTRQIVQP